jgi:hypothetical protein
VEIVIKVNRQRVKDPAAHVTTIVRRAGARCAPRARAEEIFPGLESGHSAGLVSLELPDDVAPEDSDRILQALRNDDSIEYANRPAPRTVK